MTLLSVVAGGPWLGSWLSALLNAALLLISTVVLKRRASGAFTLKAKLRGGGAPLLVRPPAPGTGGRLYLRIQDGSGYCSRFGGTAGGRVRNVANQRFDVVGPTTVAGCP